MTKNPNWKLDLEWALNKGACFKTACKFAGVSTQHAYKLKLNRPSKTISDFHEEIVTMRKQGKKLSEISNQIGYCIAVISNYCKKHDIKKARKGFERY